jgi:DNA protecting protein DprA
MNAEAPVRAEDFALARKLQWLALSLTPGVGAGRGRKLVERFGGIDRLYSASLTELEAAGLPAAAAQSIALGKSLELAAAEYDHARDEGASIIVPGDAEFPRRLLEIYDPPLVLYLKGRAEIIDQPGIAVVGTRHPTPYGVGMAERLACDLAARGLIIFSGMARGVDTAAHRGALNAHGRTVAIWGTGIDVVYPKENQKLTEQILASGGAVLSEFPLGTFPAPQNFPIRNRIISGIAVGVLVLEAGEYSGTRVTARCALEQGRDVYAVPGNVTDKAGRCAGGHLGRRVGGVAGGYAPGADPSGTACIGGAGSGITLSRGGTAASRKKDISIIAFGRVHPHRRAGRAFGFPSVFVGDIQRSLRAGVERPDQSAAGEVLREGDVSGA